MQVNHTDFGNFNKLKRVFLIFSVRKISNHQMNMLSVVFLVNNYPSAKNVKVIEIVIHFLPSILFPLHFGMCQEKHGENVKGSIMMMVIRMRILLSMELERKNYVTLLVWYTTSRYITYVAVYVTFEKCLFSTAVLNKSNFYQKLLLRIHHFMIHERCIHSIVRF